MARRSTGIACTVERTSTAICDQGTPSTQVRVPQPGRDVRRLLRLGAQHGDRDLARRAGPAPAAGPGAGAGRGSRGRPAAWPRAAPAPLTAGRCAAPRPAPGRRSAVRNGSGKPRMPATSAPRKP